MLVSALFATVLIPLVIGANDDLCLPKQVQFIRYNLETDEIDTIVIDFDKQMLASAGNTTYVQDWKALKEYRTDAAGTCVSRDMVKEEVASRCVPDSATVLAETTIGYGANALPYKAVEYNVGGLVVRYGGIVEPGEPVVPLITKVYGPSGFSAFYLAHTTNITTTLFNYPSVCSPSTSVVG